MKKGVTIVEMLVVIAVIAILTTILVPLLGVYAPTVRLSGGAKVMAAAVRKAQQLSMSTEKRYGVKFYTSLDEYRLFVREFDEDSGEYVVDEFETVDLSTGINFATIVIDGEEQTGDVELYFDAFGSPKDIDSQHISMQVTIQNTKGKVKTVDIKKNTGYVKTI